MATSLISQLPEVTSAVGDDWIEIEIAATGLSRKIKKSNLIGVTLTGGGSIATNGHGIVVPGAGTLSLLGLAQTYSALKTFGAGINLGQSNLDYYESGMWVPTIRGLTTAGSPTISNYTTAHVRIGSFVFAMVNIALSNIGGMVGQIAIGGLPWAINSVATGNVGRYNNLASSVYGVRWEGNYGNNEIVLYKIAAASGNTLTALTHSDLNNNSSFRSLMMYTI